MNQNAIVTKEEREQIFALFIKNHKLKFSEIEKALNIRSNYLDYHIKKLAEEGIVEKEGDFYKLTKEGEKLIPFYAHISGKEQGPLSIVLSAVINESENKICLLKRNKRPYLGYWGMICGKLKLAESIKEAALREAEEETGLTCKFDKIVSILHERVREEGMVKHAFVIYFCRLSVEQDELKQMEEGEVQWFDLSNLPDKMILSDAMMIKTLINKGFSCKDVVINEKEGELLDMDVKDGGSM